MSMISEATIIRSLILYFLPEQMWFVCFIIIFFLSEGIELI